MNSLNSNKITLTLKMFLLLLKTVQITELTIILTHSGIYNTIRLKVKDQNVFKLKTAALCSSKKLVEWPNMLLVHLLLLEMNQIFGLKVLSCGWVKVQNLKNLKITQVMNIIRENNYYQMKTLLIENLQKNFGLNSMLM